MSQICVNESNLLVVGKMGKMGKMGMMGKKGDADFTNSAGCAQWDWGPIGFPSVTSIEIHRTRYSESDR